MYSLEDAHLPNNSTKPTHDHVRSHRYGHKEMSTEWDWESGWDLVFVVMVGMMGLYMNWEIGEAKKQWLELDRKEWDAEPEGVVDRKPNPSNGESLFYDPEAASERVDGLLWRGPRGVEPRLSPCRNLNDSLITDVFCTAQIGSTGDIERILAGKCDPRAFASSDCAQVRACMQNILESREQEFYHTVTLAGTGLFPRTELNPRAVQKFSCIHSVPFEFDVGLNQTI